MRDVCNRRTIVVHGYLKTRTERRENGTYKIAIVTFTIRAEVAKGFPARRDDTAEQDLLTCGSFGRVRALPLADLTKPFIAGRDPVTAFRRRGK